MGHYTTDTLVTVYPFTRQSEDEEVVIGHPDTSVFLVLPTDAIELLDYLAEGKTVGEVQSLYQEKHHEVPDMDDLLNFLEQKGFVRPSASSKKERPILPIAPTKLPVTFHFANFPQRQAQKLFSRPVLLSCFAIISLAIVGIIIKPSVIPGWDAFFFRENLTLMRLTLTLMGVVTLFLHEMAHLLAAKAVGVSSRMGLSNRMWVLVAETDMTGIWGVPRNQRYLPFLAGPLLDLVCASALALVIFFNLQEWIALPPMVLQLIRALLLTYLLELLWQCYFFVRTDFYFVIANFFRCKNLMKDTETHLRNQLARIFNTIRKVDQSHIPRTERRVIVCYSAFWILGRVTAFSSLIFISIPLIWQYYLTISVVFANGYKNNPGNFIDALFMIFLVFAPQSLGIWFWIRNLRTN
jgi:putative peptide zinc metalloprotease protein